MPRMCNVSTRAIYVFLVMVIVTAWPRAGDLIRSQPARWFPDIAGDIVGAQTYTYDPASQTGTFRVVNAPHLISLGPSWGDMVHMLPDEDGTLSQSLKMKLDRHGRLVKSPDNTFQIRGTVVIGDKTYQGLLLEGKPTAFGGSCPVRPRTQTEAPRCSTSTWRSLGANSRRRLARRRTCALFPRPAARFTASSPPISPGATAHQSAARASESCPRRFPSRPP